MPEFPWGRESWWEVFSMCFLFFLSFSKNFKDYSPFIRKILQLIGFLLFFIVKLTNHTVKIPRFFNFIRDFFFCVFDQVLNFSRWIKIKLFVNFGLFLMVLHIIIGNDIVISWIVEVDFFLCWSYLKFNITSFYSFLKNNWFRGNFVVILEQCFRDLFVRYDVVVHLIGWEQDLL